MNTSSQNEVQPVEMPEGNRRTSQEAVIQEALADLSIGKASEDKSDGSKEAKMDVDDGGPSRLYPK